MKPRLQAPKPASWIHSCSAGTTPESQPSAVHSCKEGRLETFRRGLCGLLLPRLLLHPAKPRLLVGLHYLKHAFNESDELTRPLGGESVLAALADSDTLQHHVPLHSTDKHEMAKRVGADKLSEMLQETPPSL